MPYLTFLYVKTIMSCIGKQWKWGDPMSSGVAGCWAHRAHECRCVGCAGYFMASAPVFCDEGQLTMRSPAKVRGTWTCLQRHRSTSASINVLTRVPSPSLRGLEAFKAWSAKNIFCLCETCDLCWLHLQNLRASSFPSTIQYLCCTAIVIVVNIEPKPLYTAMG